MTPQEIAEVRPRLLEFAAEMFGGLPRKDQRAAGELYVRGLLTGGERKSMGPLAARAGVGPQPPQPLPTASTPRYARARRRAAPLGIRCPARTVRPTPRVRVEDGWGPLADRSPPAGGVAPPLPAIVIRSPYGRRPFGVQAAALAREGFTVLIQSCRGTWGSGGQFTPQVNEQ